MRTHKLTTIDNPYNPFTDYDSWNAFDEQQGYFTQSLIARQIYQSDELDQETNDYLYEKGLDDILKEDDLGIRVKINENTVEEFLKRRKGGL